MFFGTQIYSKTPLLWWEEDIGSYFKNLDFWEKELWKMGLPPQSFMSSYSHVGVMLSDASGLPLSPVFLSVSSILLWNSSSRLSMDLAFYRLFWVLRTRLGLLVQLTVIFALHRNTSESFIPLIKKIKAQRIICFTLQIFFFIQYSNVWKLSITTLQPDLKEKCFSLNLTLWSEDHMYLLVNGIAYEN